MVLSLIVLSANGQSDFRPGYYITNDLDTIHGYIDYRGDLRNSRLCVYKSESKAEPVKLKPGEIMAYRFDQGKYYVTKSVESEESKKQVFAEYLVNGIANLYYYRDDELDHYLIETEDGRLIPLVNEKKIIERDGVKLAWESNEHVRILKATFADCWELQPKIDKVALSHESLINITSDYHNYVCEDENCIVYQKETPRLRVNIGIDFGITSSSLRFTKHPIFGDLMFPRSLDPVIGLHAKFIFPRINEKISLLLRTEWSKSYFFNYQMESKPTGIIYHNDIHIHFNSTRLMLGLQYTYATSRIKPTIALGPVFNYHLDYAFKHIIEVEMEELVEAQDGTYMPPDDDSPGVFAQLGIDLRISKKHHLSCNMRYYYVYGVMGANTQWNSVSMNVGYYF